MVYLERLFGICQLIPVAYRIVLGGVQEHTIRRLPLLDQQVQLLYPLLQTSGSGGCIRPSPDAHDKSANDASARRIVKQPVFTIATTKLTDVTKIAKPVKKLIKTQKMSHFMDIVAQHPGDKIKKKIP